jgi:antitoxin component YwqK of YwqJK toxin-antitoxin module
MKLFSIFTLLTFYSSAFSQTTLPDNFKIGNCVEVFNKDSIKIYFNCTGVVVDRKCASYYRIGKMDSEIINVVGDFYDYDMNDKIFLKAKMLNNNLEGVVQYYYPNGNVKEEGIYQNNVRQGKWTFYYPNGNIQKVYDYVNDEPIVLEAYSSNGKATVVNGNGSFKTEFSRYKQCNNFETSGQLVNGKKVANGHFQIQMPVYQ